MDTQLQEEHAKYVDHDESGLYWKYEGCEQKVLSLILLWVRQLR